MMPPRDRVHEVEKCNQNINFADDSSVTAREKAVRLVMSEKPNGVENLTMSDTSVIPKLAMRFLSVPDIL